MLKHNLTPKTSISNADIVQKDNKTQFYKLMTPELRQLYELKLLDAPAYILLIVKTQRAAGWRWTFKVKDFCQEWGLNERTFYRSVSKLKTLGLLHWATGDTITVWHGADIAKDDIILPLENSDTSDSDISDMSINTLTRVSVPVSSVSVVESPVSVPVSSVSAEISETLAKNDSQDASDLNQIFLDQTDNAAALKTLEEKENINQEGSNLHPPASLIDKPGGGVKLTDPHVDQGSAPLVALKAVLPPVTQPTQPTQAEVSPALLVTPKAQSAPVDLLDEREALKEMRKLGIEDNQEVRARMKKYPGRVSWSLADIRRRVGKGEPIKNVTGAYMTNLKTAEKDREPIDNTPSFGLHLEVNPPSEQQLQALEAARVGGLIRDFFFSSTTNTHRVVLRDFITQVDWWEYLGVDVAT